MAEPIILAEQLTKTFTRYRSAGRFQRRRTSFTAVDGIDLRVEPGELVGYIGPNGAGKSTTATIASRFCVASGDLEVADPRCHRDSLGC